MTNTTTTPNGVKHVTTKSPITLDKIYKGDFQKEGTLTAQIRQIVTRVSSYPSKKTSSDLQANIFSNEDFGFGTQDFESTETRIAWIPVPANATQDQVKAKLDAAMKNGATIYRVLSNAPIIDENQRYAIGQALKTKDDFAKSQVVRYPDTEENKEKGIAGRVWTDISGKVQYRRTFLWLTSMEDQDLRGKGESYISPEIQAELTGANILQGQTI